MRSSRKGSTNDTPDPPEFLLMSQRQLSDRKHLPPKRTTVSYPLTMGGELYGPSTNALYVCSLPLGEAVTALRSRFVNPWRTLRMNTRFPAVMGTLDFSFSFGRSTDPDFSAEPEEGLDGSEGVQFLSFGAFEMVNGWASEIDVGYAPHKVRYAL
jgi:hypothetical protein